MRTINEELLFGCMTYKDMMALRAQYNKGNRSFYPRQANALYLRLVRKGWATGMKEQAKNVTTRDGEGR
ncbi:hypothetical protein [Acinetobacter proteolyticus]|uniref:hypothetical protein n=1 Tax=Acinetobacter proteolyticus TaxID=1776741 RepID=UPI003D95EA73